MKSRRQLHQSETLTDPRRAERRPYAIVQLISPIVTPTASSGETIRKTGIVRTNDAYQRLDQVANAPDDSHAADHAPKAWVLSLRRCEVVGRQNLARGRSAMLCVLWLLLTTRRWQRLRLAVTGGDKYAPDFPVPSTAMHASAATLDTWAFCSSGILRKLSRTPGNTAYRSRRRRRSLAIHCRSRSPIPSIPNLTKSGLSLSGHLIGCVPWSWYILT
jgi:hypothetical protein